MASQAQNPKTVLPVDPAFKLAFLKYLEKWPDKSLILFLLFMGPSFKQNTALMDTKLPPALTLAFAMDDLCQGCLALLKNYSEEEVCVAAEVVISLAND